MRPVLLRLASSHVRVWQVAYLCFKSTRRLHCILCTLHCCVFLCSLLCCILCSVG